MVRVVSPALWVGGVASIMMASAVAVVGCAMSSPADLTPDVDMTLPGVDAAYEPHPAPGPQGLPAHEKDSGTGEKTPPDPMDSGSTPPPDAAPVVDAGPALAKPSAGEVLITEVMFAPTTPEPTTEWLELHSVAPAVRSLAGLVLKDGAGRTHLIGSALTIAPGAYVVLARNKSAAMGAHVPGAAIVYEYGTGQADNAGILLANGATGGVALLNGSTTIASSPYGGWFSSAAGASIQLKVLDATQATAKASWCLSGTVWMTGSGKGTPGAAGDCP